MTHRPQLLWPLAMLVVALAGCTASLGPPDTGTGSRAASTTTAHSTPPSSTTSGGHGAYVTIRGRRIAIPTEGNRPIEPVSAVGEQIVILPGRIEPHLLFCDIGARLTVTNLTNDPQQLRFVNDGGWRSPIIPPGGTWHYTPKYGISYYYVTNTGLHATFQPSPPYAGL